MAGALRPVVLMMVLASALLVADGLLDGVRPGGAAWLNDAYHGVAWSSYLFAGLNFLVAVLVARGSERSLVGRIGLSGFFLVERPLTAVVLGPKPAASVAVHAVTALVELVILLGALRIWRLGRSFEADDVSALFALGGAVPPAAAAARSDDRPPAAAGTAFGVAILALALAGVLVADGAVQGYLPGGKAWGIAPEALGWTTYVLAAIVLTVSSRSVRGSVPWLRLQFAFALALFVERAFSPLVVPIGGAAGLAFHGLAAFLALALALVSVGALRSGVPVRPATLGEAAR